jgi:hypothetical protein
MLACRTGGVTKIAENIWDGAMRTFPGLTSLWAVSLYEKEGFQPAKGPAKHRSAKHPLRTTYHVSRK